MPASIVPLRSLLVVVVASAWGRKGCRGDGDGGRWRD